jgi:hypothetical protein
MAPAAEAFVGAAVAGVPAGQFALRIRATDRVDAGRAAAEFAEA